MLAPTGNSRSLRALASAYLIALVAGFTPVQDFDAAAWRDHILPTDTEAAWLKVPWRRNLTAAVFEAEALEQPVLIWTVEGDPFGCNCKGRAERRFLWATPALRDLSELFVPVCASADDLVRDSAFFRRLLERSGLRGEVPGRGIFACTPDGTPLGALDSTRVSEVQAMLEQAVLDWHETPDSSHVAAIGPRPTPVEYPAGAALMVASRDLPPELDPRAPPSPRWSRDHFWLIDEEAQAFLPKKLELGQTRKLPQGLTQRLARFNLLDNVLGPTLPFEPAAIQHARLTSKIVAVDAQRVQLELRGATRARSRAPWPRALETKLRGRAVWDRSASRFESFDLVGLGSRRGRTPRNGRSLSQDPTPIGFVLSLDGEPSKLNVPRFYDF